MQDKEKTAPDGLDQERAEIVSRYGDTEVHIAKDEITLSVH